jgi:hypothetical protein
MTDSPDSATPLKVDFGAWNDSLIYLDVIVKIWLIMG